MRLIKREERRDQPEIKRERERERARERERERGSARKSRNNTW